MNMFTGLQSNPNSQGNLYCSCLPSVGPHCVVQVCNPLTSTINISTEHRGRGGIIKMVLEDFDPKVEGVMVVAGALEQKKNKYYMCGKMVLKKVIAVQ